MGRKKKATFEWIADGVEGELAREGLREDRKALKARLVEVDRLILRMVRLHPPERAKLPLEPDAMAALEGLAGMKSGAFKRQLGFLAGLLRDVEIDVLSEAVEAIRP